MLILFHFLIKHNEMFNVRIHLQFDYIIILKIDCLGKCHFLKHNSFYHQERIQMHKNYHILNQVLVNMHNLLYILQHNKYLMYIKSHLHNQRYTNIFLLINSNIYVDLYIHLHIIQMFQYLNNMYKYYYICYHLQVQHILQYIIQHIHHFINIHLVNNLQHILLLLFIHILVNIIKHNIHPMLNYIRQYQLNNLIHNNLFKYLVNQL